MSGKNVSKTILTQTRFNAKEISEVRKLTDDQRNAVRKFLENANTQAKQDAVAEQQIKIEPHTWTSKKDGKPVQVSKVQLDFFTIESDTSEDFLKRAAFRMNKVCNAYKQYFGVDRQPSAKVRVLIFN